MVKIHQTLHGYDQGHHLLSSTILIKSSDDMQLMSLMSDWAGFDNKYDEHVSYLTAYPLSEVYYVVAMTWYADDMPRPGCVWTHSLLIRKDELDRIPDFKKLYQLFHRPTKIGNYSEYGKVIEVSEDEPKGGFGNVPLEEVNMAAVYVNLLQGTNPLKYRVTRGNKAYQELILHLMNYIPGGVLQRFCFSSGSTMVRMLGNRLFDLQFVVNSNDGYSELNEEKSWPEVSVMNYIDYAISHGNYEIRSLLQMFAKDIGTSEVNWVRVISLFVHLHVISKSEDTKKADLFVGLMEEISKGFPGKGDGKVIKSRFALPEISNMMIDNYRFLVESSTNETFQSFTDEQIHLERRLQDILSIDNHTRFFDLIMEIYKKGLKTEMGLEVFLMGTKVMDDGDFKRLLEENYSVLISMLPYNNQIINNKVWIEAPKELFEHIFTMFTIKAPEPFDYWPDLFDAIIRNESLVLESMVQQMWQHVENPLERLLNLLNEEGKHQFVSPAIIDECGKQKKEMMAWLKDNQIKNEDVARIYMKHFMPGSQEVKDYAAEDWNHFVIQGMNLETSYFVYLYNLSFSWQLSKTAFGYFQKAFYPLYVLALTNKLQEYYWKQIENNTVSLWIADWDKCKKMRLMAAKRARALAIEDVELLNFTPDYELNLEILKYYIRMKGKK